MPSPSQHSSRRVPLDFAQLVSSSEAPAGIPRATVRTGDRIEVRTHNSVYTLTALGQQRFQVAGGWFERTVGGPAVVAIVGCTWGGSAVKRDMIAACGMRIEFNNRVITSVIQRIVHFPGGILN